MYAAGVISPSTSDYGSLSGGVILFNETNNGSQVIQQDFFYRPRYFIPLPYGVTAISRPHSVARYNGRTYIVGCYNYNVMLDEYHRMWKQGIRPPVIAPTITGATGTGRTCYLSWWDDVSAERSPISPGIEIGSGTPRVWSNLPTRPPDDLFSSEGKFNWNGEVVEGTEASRIFYMRPGDSIDYGVTGLDLVTMVRGTNVFNSLVKQPTDEYATILPVTRATHLELWMSVAGGNPRLIMRVPVGTTTVTESTAVGLLGETYSGSFERFPRCTMNTIYHDRQIMAGNTEAPDTIYLSDLFYPERYSGMSFRTRNGEPVVSLIGTKDYCLIMTPTSGYILQGYTENDLTLTVADPNIGAVTHVGNVVIHGVPYVWTTSGPYMFNGSWHPISPENRHYLREEQIGAAVPFEFWNGTHDPVWNTWNTGGRFVMDYTTVQPEAGGGMQVARFSEDDLTSANIYPYTLASSWEHLSHFMTPYASSEGALFTAVDPMGVIPIPLIGDIDPAEFSFWIVKMGTGRYASGTTIRMGRISSIGGTFQAIVPALFEVVTGYHIIGGDAGPREAKIFRKVWYHAMAEGALTAVYQGQVGGEDTWIYTTIDACPHSGEENLTYALANPPESRPLTNSMFAQLNGMHMPGYTVRASGRGLTVRVIGERVSGRVRFNGFGGYFTAGPQTGVY